MSKLVKIYKNGDFTCVDVTINGKTEYLSSDKGRSLKVIPNGVQILPDPEEKILNNFKILISELEDDYGATTGKELRDELLTRNFFKKGGGGVFGGDLSDYATKNELYTGLDLKAIKTGSENIKFKVDTASTDKEAVNFKQLKDYTEANEKITNVEETLYIDANKVIRQNIATATQHYIYVSGSQNITLDIPNPTYIVSVFLNGKYIPRKHHNYTSPNIFSIDENLEADDELEITYEYFINPPI
ncbi:hypothetical protein [Polaribacter aestuariivivens]|uniref:hypothetical protein n=1 Tax=Polaribacter aestuariivivens TaxID=2304626 RepID=UPI003F4952D7